MWNKLKLFLLKLRIISIVNSLQVQLCKAANGNATIIKTSSIEILIWCSMYVDRENVRYCLILNNKTSFESFDKTDSVSKIVFESRFIPAWYYIISDLLSILAKR